jgi:hypothetical protein
MDSRSEADDSLSILEMYRVGLVTFRTPALSSLEHNCTGLAVELETE